MLLRVQLQQFRTFRGISCGWHLSSAEVGCATHVEIAVRTVKRIHHGVGFCLDFVELQQVRFKDWLFILRSCAVGIFLAGLVTERN